jgi:hypothetical protein
MPKKTTKKTKSTHNENKNHIHIHIGDKKGKRGGKGRKRSGGGSGGGGTTSVQSIVHPPNVIIPHYNRPQYLESSTLSERENQLHNRHSINVPNIAHYNKETQTPVTDPRALPSQVPVTKSVGFQSGIPDNQGFSSPHPRVSAAKIHPEMKEARSPAALLGEQIDRLKKQHTPLTGGQKAAMIAHELTPSKNKTNKDYVKNPFTGKDIEVGKGVYNKLVSQGIFHKKESK